MKNCETCKHWADITQSFDEKGQIRKCGNYEKINDDIYNSEPDGLYYLYQDGGTFYTGPKFGCVHHKEKNK